ncbi:MAG: SpoIIIAH-like family protein [Clostridia bacterium]|nr:SpoIIIAH-like family protein [Clostridia bacterium]
MKWNWLGKKQVILGALVIALGAAVYANYTFASEPLAFEVAGSKTTASQTTTTTKNLGESTYVNAEAGDYFKTARSSRESARDEAIELIEDLLDDVRLTDEIQQQALQKASALADAVTAESDIEQLVKAKGFADCVAYLTEDGCQLVVKAEKLTPEQSLQILDIVTSQTTVSSQNINIVAVP